MTTGIAQPSEAEILARRTGLPVRSVTATMALLDEGNTVPFLTRYRREQTGGLDETQIRTIQQQLEDLRALKLRATAILKRLQTQNVDNPQLIAAIQQAETLTELEDLYAPFKQQRRTRAEIARERGLQPLADKLWEGTVSQPLTSLIAPFIKSHADLPDGDAVLAGVSDILAEQISMEPEVRKSARQMASISGELVVRPGKTPNEALFGAYHEATESVRRAVPHRVLAIHRGESTGALKVRFDWNEPQVLQSLERVLQRRPRPFLKLLPTCLEDAMKRLLKPSAEREVRRKLLDDAHQHAVQVFARNLRSLLLQPPTRGSRVLAIDPGFRTGCKLAALDEYGNLLAHDVIYLTGSSDRIDQARTQLVSFAKQHRCELFVIGNGTACRETEQLVAEAIADSLPTAHYVIVNEAGASVYSTSDLAREEFPELDPTVRGTVSIGRRLLDPLSELVKVESRHVGVGLYQHDLDPKLLDAAADQVVESCVNRVGVDLNSASASLLRHVAGLNESIARKVVAYRDQHGPFESRRQLLDVAGIGPATFQQSAGFLRVRGGDEPLDETWIHPESYDIARRLLSLCGKSSVEKDSRSEGKSLLPDGVQPEELATRLQVSVEVVDEIVRELGRPGHDPRTEAEGPVFRRQILKLEEVCVGMTLTGSVLNVVDFGAFVDVGLKESGLIHVSRMGSRHVRDPHQVLAVGDRVTVWVEQVDLPRRRLALSMQPVDAP
ncbi:MAG: Tex family protein [Planctomycetaceae bacterium]